MTDAYDVLHGIATVLHRDISVHLVQFVINNAPYYCRFMSDLEFAAAAFCIYTPTIPPTVVTKALLRLDKTSIHYGTLKRCMDQINDPRLLGGSYHDLP